MVSQILPGKKRWLILASAVTGRVLRGTARGHQAKTKVALHGRDIRLVKLLSRLAVRRLTKRVSGPFLESVSRCSWSWQTGKSKVSSFTNSTNEIFYHFAAGMINMYVFIEG